MSESVGTVALPQVQDVLSEVSSSAKRDASSSSQYEVDYIEDYRLKSVRRQVEYAHLEGIKDHYKHKGRWSIFLMAAVGGMLAFQSILLWRVGLGLLDFKDYDWLLPALLVQNLGQVIGLAVYAVKYLFSDISSQKTN